MGNLFSWKFELSQSCLEMLEAFGIVYANLELRRVAEIAPSLLATGNTDVVAAGVGVDVMAGKVQAKVFLFGR